MTDYVDFTLDGDGILTASMNDPAGRVNVMNGAFLTAMETILSHVENASSPVSGLILTSSKSTFFAGGDLEEILAVNTDNQEAYRRKVNHIKSLMRRLETLGVPVVTAINGAALGGGYEICLASHYRIAIDQQKMKIGLPEVTLGLLPGGGGVIRLARLLGLKAALPHLIHGTAHDAKSALKFNLVDELVDGRDSLMLRAKQYILASPSAVQPWDRPEREWKPEDPSDDTLKSVITDTQKEIADTFPPDEPAAGTILKCAVESLQMDIEAAGLIETDYLVDLAKSPAAKRLISGFFDTTRAKAS